MIYLSLTVNVVLLGLLAWHKYSSDRDRDRQREREDTLLNRIQAPAVAIAQSVPDPGIGHIPVSEDDLLADLEEERARELGN